MKHTAEQICKKFNKALSIKTTWDTEYREVFEYCMPARDGYQKAVNNEKILPEFQDRRENLYSSVGEQAANEYVNTMQELLAPPMADWIDLEAGSKFKEEDKQGVNEELEKLTTFANEHKNNSSFDMVFSEFCYDLFAGTGCMLVLPGTPRNPVTFRAVPIREYCLDEGANGEVDAVYRKYEMKKELVKHQWKETKKMKLNDGDKDKGMELLEATYYDYDLNAWHYCVLDFSNKKFLVEREYKTNPFITLRWNKCAGEPYGRGVGLTALNDIKTLNLIKYYSLRNFAFNIPPLLVQEDAMLDVDGLELTPLSLNVVPDTQTSIVPLQIPVNYDIENYKLQELTMDIKRNTYSNTLPNEGSKNLTATEVIQRRQDMNKSIASVFGRLVNEFQLPLVRRIFDVLIDTKVIKDEFDVTQIDGFIYKIKINTPISKLLQVGEARSIINAVSYLVQLDPTGQMVGQLLKVNKLGNRLMGLLGVPNDLINSEEEIQQTQVQMQEAQAAAQQNAVETDVNAANAKELGKTEAEMIKNEAI